MLRTGILFAIACACFSLGIGCGPLGVRTAEEQQLFGPATFRIHPTFTQIKNWTTGKKPDGIEAVIEFQDQFGDPTRAAGKVRFELYGFRSADPDHRGPRIATWTGSIQGHDEQVSHWDQAARGYSFQLGYPKISNSRAYVLVAQFDRNNTRLFDQLIIEPSNHENFHGDRRNQHAPTDAPSHGY